MDHFIEQNAQRPDVHLASVTLHLQNFGSHVVVSPAVGGSVVFTLEGRPAEVCDFDVALGVQEKVLGLQVPVDDAPVMDVVEPEGGLQDINEGLSLDESLFSLHVLEEVTVLREVEHHIDILGIFETKVQLQNVVVFEGLLDFDFLLHVALQVVFLNQGLLDNFQSVDFVVGLESGQKDLSIRASPQFPLCVRLLRVCYYFEVTKLSFIGL